MKAFAGRRAWILAAAALLLLAPACGSQPAAGVAPQPTALASRSADPTPAPPTPPAPTTARPEPAPAAPASLPVAFYNLPAGTYPVHIHSACNGAQAFHVAVVQSLSVGRDGSGSIQVPSSYFGRGLCVIVYSSNTLSRVLTTRGF